MEYFANIISDCSFKIISGDYSCSPGVIYSDMISRYYPNLSIKHILFTSPFKWEFQPLIFDNIYVTWLMAVPITELEFQYAIEHDVETLLDLFESNSVNVFDPYRQSLI